MQTKGIRIFGSTFCKLAGISLAVGLVVRVVLLLQVPNDVTFGAGEWLKIFLLGAVNDLAVAVISFVFMWLYLSQLSETKYKKPTGYIIVGICVLGLIYLTFFNNILREYGSVVPKIGIGLLLYETISFGLRLFIPSIRAQWSRVVYYILFAIYVFTTLFNGIGAYFFWDEFGVRYNFIAVDYLIYTNEVVGNIMESYPMIPLLLVLLTVSGLLTWAFNSHLSFPPARKSQSLAVIAGLTRNPLNKTRMLIRRWRIKSAMTFVSLVYILLFVASYFVLKSNEKFQKSDNVYTNELQANSVYKFYTAFINSELSYTDFYITLSDAEAVEIVNSIYHSQGAENLQTISDSVSSIKKNIVLIMCESLSAEFLARYGDTKNLTPNLNKLIDESLSFDNLYATGTRTVRGLEAITLCLPPSSGESIVKQPNNANLFSTGSVLKKQGYTTQFFYGGDGYFDNMTAFFAGNGYEVIDKNQFEKDEITFSNIWGVCDEDLFAKVLKELNKNARNSIKPFFAHIMTTSNHRPFTYPEGKIDIPTDSKSRAGGVKYSDYAIGKFIEHAKKESWFTNTVFVIIADHCASSAGKTSIPLDKYQIPCIVYAPGFVAPKRETRLVSQIDIMPTIFGRLHLSYNSYFYGKDIYSADYPERAFVATYQNLGYLEPDKLTVLSPVRRVEQFQVTQNGSNFDLSQLEAIDSVAVKTAVALYQTGTKILIKQESNDIPVGN
ncbi:MAG: LTA synthase family protein [Candidatus Symbiothrix sp.]|jgi:phosphoglycerol transferase MdoB-like AlkP superfamily enzyme|nr:LTA synthase family protein [Candidatus Symbiothrix sp.]